MIYGLNKLVGVHPTLWAATGYIALRSNYDWKVVSGARSSDEQAANYAIGRTVALGSTPVTDAPPGSSPHEFGLAIDIQPTLDKGASVVQDLSHPAWDEKSAALKAFPSLREITLKEGSDRPHMELANWTQMKDWKKNFAVASAVAMFAAVLFVK